MLDTPEDHPRELLKTLIADNPTLSQQEILDLFAARAVQHRKYYIPALHAWAAMNYPARTKPTAVSGAVLTKTEKAKATVALKSHITTQARILFMEIVMPTGKKLKQSTFRDCADAGGWFSRIAHAGHPDDIVGVVLTEEEVVRLWTLSNA